MVTQMWEGVARMTALARDTTHSLLDGSALLGGAGPACAASAPGACPGSCSRPVRSCTPAPWVFPAPPRHPFGSAAHVLS